LTFQGGAPTEWAQDHLRIPGDFNLDRAVDAADYVVWRKTDGTPAGYNEWRANFGWMAGSASGSASAAVPEPATFTLAGFLFAMFVARVMETRRRFFLVLQQRFWFDSFVFS
jgi:hypothetical protein